MHGGSSPARHPFLSQENSHASPLLVKFAPSETPSPLNLGCGISAYNLADAKQLLTDQVFTTYGPREIAEVTEDVDISTLDELHVRPNMGLPVKRGVWFPLLSLSI
jgi:hypothetical protein